MKNRLLAIAFLIMHHFAFAQTDTTIVYYTKEGDKTTKDSSETYMKSYRQGNFWYGVSYYTKSNQVQSEGNYAEKDLKTPVGKFKNFKDGGELDYVGDYSNERVEKTWYYKNGSKRSWILYNGKTVEQKGWDQSGKEIKDYVVEREARFKGGLENWKKFLEKNLNGNVAADAGAPTGSYTVKAQFIIDKEGYVTNVKPVITPEKCKPCAGEVVRMLVSAPRWEPAIQHNVPVIYQAIQNVTFQVAEEKKRKKW